MKDILVIIAPVLLGFTIIQVITAMVLLKKIEKMFKNVSNDNIELMGSLVHITHLKTIMKLMRSAVASMTPSGPKDTDEDGGKTGEDKVIFKN